MTYTGRVENGVVIFAGPERPREGAVVEVQEVSESPKKVGEGLDRLAGRAEGLPADVAERHDEYRRERRGL